MKNKVVRKLVVFSLLTLLTTTAIKVSNIEMNATETRVLYDEFSWNYRINDDSQEEKVNQAFLSSILTELDLRNIEDITQEELNKIERLNLSDLNIEEIPFVINSMPNLKELNLDNNNIQVIHPDIEEKIKSLDEFSIKGNYLINVRQDILDKFKSSSFKYNLLNNERDQYEIDLNRNRETLAEIDGITLDTILGRNSQDELRKIIPGVFLKEGDIDDVNEDGFPVSKPLPENIIINMKKMTQQEIDELEQSKDLEYFSYYKAEFELPTVNLEQTIVEVEVPIEPDEDIDPGFGIDPEHPLYPKDDLEDGSEEDKDEGSETDPENPEPGEDLDDGLDDGFLVPPDHPAIDEDFDDDYTGDLPDPEPEDEFDWIPIKPSNPIEYETIEVAEFTKEDIIIRSEEYQIIEINRVSEESRPRIWAITPDIYDWTNKDVIIDISALNSAIDGTTTGLQYSLDKGKTFQSSNKFTIKSNQEVTVIVKNNKGILSRPAKYEIDNIDKTPPQKPNVKIYLTSDGTKKDFKQSQNAKGWVNKEVTVEVTNRIEARGGDLQSPIDYMFLELESKDLTGKHNRLRETDLNKYYIKNLKDKVRVGFRDVAGNESLLTDWTQVWVDTEAPVILSHYNNLNTGGWTINRLTKWQLVDYKDNLSTDIGLTLDGKNWITLQNLEKFEKEFDQTTYLKVALRDEADNLSSTLNVTIYADNIAPKLTGYKIVPEGWTNGNVNIYPVGDHTGSSWQRVGIDRHYNDIWTHRGYYTTEVNFENKQMRAGDQGNTDSLTEVPVTIKNIDKIDPYISSATSKNLGNGKSLITIIGGDPVIQYTTGGANPTPTGKTAPGSGIHSTQGYSINDSPYSSKNTIEVSNSSSIQRIKVSVQDKATNKSEPNYVYVQNGNILGIPATAETNKTFNKWGKEDHVIKIYGGSHLSGFNGYQYRIKTTINSLGQRVNTYSNWATYTAPITISQEGELELEIALVAKNGDRSVISTYPVWIDKTPPDKPVADVYSLYRGQKIPYTTFKDTNWSKFPVYSLTNNFYTADKLSKVEYRTNRVADGKPTNLVVGDKLYTLYAPGGRSVHYYVDKAGNISPGLGLGSMGPSSYYLNKVNKFPSGTTDKNVGVEIQVEKRHYIGLHEESFSKDIYKNPPYTANQLNLDYYDSSEVMKYTRPNITPDSKGQRFASHKYTVEENGTYYFYARSREDFIAMYSFVVDNIDKKPPVITSVKKSTDQFTRDPITLTVNATDDCKPDQLLYSFDNGITYSTSNKYTVHMNQKVDISVKDTFGRVTKYTPVDVNNIDFYAPVVKGITQNVDESGKRTSLTLVAEDVGVSGLNDIYISTDGKTWNRMNDMTLNFNSSQKVFLRDKLNNTSELVVNVSDKGTATISPVISGSIPDKGYTRDNVTLTIGGAILPTEIQMYLYQINHTLVDGSEENTAWSKYNPDLGLTINREGKHIVTAKAVDMNGVESSMSVPYEVNIVRNIPEIIDIKGNPTAWTNKVELEIVAKNAAGGEEEISEYSYDGSKKWQASSRLEVKENNSSYTALAKDKTGLISDSRTVSVNYLDFIKPTGKLEVTGEPFEEQEIKISDILDPVDPTRKSGTSGIESIFYQIGDEEPVEYIEDDNSGGEVEVENRILVTEPIPNLEVKVFIKDFAGNVTTLSKTLNINVLDAEVSIKNDFIVNKGDNESESLLRIKNKGTPINVQLNLDATNGIPLTYDTDIDWDNLTMEETESKAQITLNTQDGYDMYYVMDNPNLKDRKLMDGLSELTDMRKGEVALVMKLQTGTSWETSKDYNYNFHIIIGNKYK